MTRTLLVPEAELPALIKAALFTRQLLLSNSQSYRKGNPAIATQNLAPALTPSEKRCSG